MLQIHARQLVQRFFRSACLVLGILLFLLYLNHAIYCVWAAGASPTPYPTGWLHQATSQPG